MNAARKAVSPIYKRALQMKDRRETFLRLVIGGVFVFLRLTTPLAALLLMSYPARAQDIKVVAVPGRPALLLGGFDLATLGYATEEFFISGTATSYTLAEPATEDGKW